MRRLHSKMVLVGYMNHQNCDNQPAIVLTKETVRAFELIPFPVMVVSLDSVIAYTNPAFQALAEQIDPDGAPHLLSDPGFSALTEAVQQFAFSGDQSAEISISTWIKKPAHSFWLLHLSRHECTFLSGPGVCVVFESVPGPGVGSDLPADFLGGLIHQVRNPIFAISSTLDAFEARFGVSPEQEPFVAVLRAEQRRLMTILHEVLEFDSPLPVEFSEGPFLSTLQCAIDHCVVLASDRNITLELVVSGDLPSFHMDSQALQQAWILLIEGAIHASTPNQKVTIQAQPETYRSQPGVVVEFLDQGPFFKEGDLGRLCEPFVSKRCGESGLGFSIVKRVIDTHFGRLEAANLPSGLVQIKAWLPVRCERAQ